jgi:serine protease Do
MVKSFTKSIPRFLILLILVAFVATFMFHFSIQTSPNTPSVSAQMLNQPQSPFVKVYEKVSPAVVRIDVKSEVVQQVDPMWQRFFGLPQQQKQLLQGEGSGVIIDHEGHVITNNHVVAGAKEIKVILGTNETYDATVVGSDPETDVAVIKLKNKTFQDGSVAELGDSDQLKPGDWAIAIGNPLGLDRTITVGVISALGRTGLQAENGPRIQNFIQTDAQINPGNSGGALTDINGKVIGINDMYTEGYAGIGFAIPINLVKSVMNKIIATGKVAHGFLGIQMKNIDQDTKAALDLSSTGGVLVNSLVPKGPAEKAGLKVGDVITDLDGKPIKNTDDFLNRISDHNPGDTVKLEIIESGIKKTVSVTLADYNDFAKVATASTKSESVWRGIHVAGLDSQQFNLPESIKSGVIVVDIDDNSPAAGSQLQEGDIITQIWIGKIKRDIKNIQDFNTFANENKNNNRTMLIYRTEIMNNGQIIRGLVSIRGEK